MIAYVPGLAENDAAGILQLVVVLVIMFGSAIFGWIKKQADEKSDKGKGSSAPRPSAPPSVQHRWPPAGTTTGTTVPGPSRPVPRAQTPPPVARPARATDEGGMAHQRMEQMEVEMRRRAEHLDDQMQPDVAASERREQAEAIATERVRRATEQAHRAARKAAAMVADARAAADAATAVRMKPHARAAVIKSSSPHLPPYLESLLTEPNWKTAVVLAEIFGPPIALRAPGTKTATTPPSLAP